jgi:hypothetical protein
MTGRHLWQRPSFTGATGRDGYDAVYDSWSEFVTMSTAAKGEHPDHNILYGWNWCKPGYGYRDDTPHDGDEVLETFWILPFRNVLMTLTTEVVTSDEANVAAWLLDRGAWLADQWRPLVVVPNPEHRPPTGDAP